MTDLDPQPTDPQDQHHAPDTTSLVAAMQGLTGPATDNEELPCLPAEIIFFICHHFTVHSHNPEKSFSVSRDTIDNIRALRQLSLTCRSIYNEVTPALYSCIYFTGPPVHPELPVSTHYQHQGAESLVYFLRTMLDNVRLRQHVKELACLIDLRDRCFFKEEMSIHNKDYGILSTVRNCEDNRTLRLLEIAGSWIEPLSGSRLGLENAFGMASRRPIISLSHQAFALVACLLPNVTLITLKTGSYRSCYPQSTDLYGIKTRDIAGRSRCNMAHYNILKSLTVLQVQCEPQSTFAEAQLGTISLTNMMPLLLNASNLTQVRCYGSDSTWSEFPDAVASFECWGPVSNTPVGFGFRGSMLQHLKVMVIHLDCAATAVDFDLNRFCVVLVMVAPELEHLNLLLSPETCIDPNTGCVTVTLQEFTGLRHFCFDTRFFHDIYWDEQTWLRIDPDWWSMQLRGIETLCLVDSKPRGNLDRILEWLDTMTWVLHRPGNESRLKKVEYIHMPCLAEMNRNSGVCGTSTLANEMKQELALHDVEFHLSLVNDGNGEFSGANSLKQEIRSQENIHDVGV